jgi:hypothetical protein
MTWRTKSSSAWTSRAIPVGFTFTAGQLTILDALNENGLELHPPGRTTDATPLRRKAGRDRSWIDAHGSTTLWLCKLTVVSTVWAWQSLKTS